MNTVGLNAVITLPNI